MPLRVVFVLPIVTQRAFLSTFLALVLSNQATPNTDRGEGAAGIGLGDNFEDSLSVSQMSSVGFVSKLYW